MTFRFNNLQSLTLHADKKVYMKQSTKSNEQYFAMNFEELAVTISPSAFAVLFTQDSGVSQSTDTCTFNGGTSNVDLVINVSEDEFFGQETNDPSPMDGTRDIGTSEDTLGQVVTSIPASNKGFGNNVDGPISNGICHLESFQRPYESDMSDDACPKDQESYAKKRCKFPRETESNCVVHLARNTEISSNGINIVENYPGLSPSQLLGAEGTSGSVGAAGSQHNPSQYDEVELELEMSEFMSLIIISPLRQRVNKLRDASADVDAGTLALLGPADATGHGPPCFRQEADVCNPIPSHPTPARNVRDRLGPKVHSGEERLIIIRNRDDIANIDGDFTQDDFSGFPDDAYSLPDQYNSPRENHTLDSFNGDNITFRSSLLDVADEPSNSQLANSDASEWVAKNTVGIGTSCISNKFISHDPDEKADNDDPNWQLLFNLSTDDERYKAVRQRWKNLTIPNPNQDLTIQNYRKKISALNKQAGASTDMITGNKRKRSISEPIEEMPRAKRLRRNSRSTCVNIFDKKIDLLHRKLKLEIKNNDSKCQREMEQSTESSQFQIEVHEKFQRYSALKASLEMECKAKEVALKESRNEILTVFRFYCGLKNSSNVSGNADALNRQQLLEIKEQEIMYNKYDEDYI